jgi:hypothetical protein
MFSGTMEARLAILEKKMFPGEPVPCRSKQKRSVDILAVLILRLCHELEKYLYSQKVPCENFSHHIVFF